MGGELSVDSAVGKGSTFTVTLRGVRTVEPPARNPEGADRAGRPGRFPARVLVVDDSPVNRAVLRAMLAKNGSTDVVLAANGREALALLETGPAFDAVLSDLWMPELDGRGLVNVIRSDASLAGLPVYLVTADVEARDQAEADGFAGVLLKPISLENLRKLFA